MLRLNCQFAAGMLLAVCLSPASAQDAPVERLMDQPPFDVLTLDRANDNKVYKVYPVKLPGRRVPEKPKPTEKLRVKLIEEEQEYDVAWANIAKLELYEQLVLAEASKFAAEGKFDEAYDEFVFLLAFYPQTQGLAEARQNYLFLSSAAAFRQQKYDEALAILEELLALNANFRQADGGPTLLQRLGDVADRLLAIEVERQDYRAARTLLNRLIQQYRADNEPFAKKWRERLVETAARYRDEAQQQLDAGHYMEAYDAAAKMQTTWPEVEGGRALIAEISRKHSLVRVGVEHPARQHDSQSLFDVSARRTGRLTQRLFEERIALGVEGGKYESPLGVWTRSDDGQSLSFRISAPALGSPYDLAQRLLLRATPDADEYDADWSRIVQKVGITSPQEVTVELRAAYVLPEALLPLQLHPVASQPETAFQPYLAAAGDRDSVRYAANRDYALARPGQPMEVVERYISDPQRALIALKRGEIDVLDRVYPGDIPALKSDESIVVAPYAGPTAHVLAIRSQHPFLSNRTFRRGLLYGANRELLLSQGLLRGATIPGFRLVSSPFPAPSPGMELPTYGYDATIEPRPFDPRLGMALVLLSEGEIKAAYEKQKQPAPQRQPIVLGHPADETSRIACRGLVKDWKRIGVEAKLLEFSPGVFDDKQRKCDLVYLQIRAWEPLIDGQRLFGLGGLSPTTDQHVQLLLREIGEARNWQQVRQRLIMLHRLMNEDLSLLPLWQTMDHFAYRKTLRGLAPRRLELYDDVEQWQVSPQLASSRP